MYAIRQASPDDAEAIVGIYAPYVLNTFITYEYEVPDAEEFRRRMAKTLARYPYLVATDAEGDVVGYAYASPFHPRAAYQWGAELSVYVRDKLRGHGIGHMLYEALSSILVRQHILTVYACIAYPNPQSIVFHEQMGFSLVSLVKDCAYKLGEWHGMVWMEKKLHSAPLPCPPLAFIPYSELATCADAELPEMRQDRSRQ